MPLKTIPSSAPLSRNAKGKDREIVPSSSTLPNVALPLPDSASPGHGAPRAWTLQDKIEYFQQLPPILCPASPPPLAHPLMTEQEASQRSRERIERMTKRLASLPIYQARHLINLASTQMKGPFNSGCKYWGVIPPVATETTDNDSANGVSTSDIQPPPFPDVPRRALDRPNHLPAPPGPSSTAFSGPVSPSTPPPIFQVAVKLVPAKTSTGRPLVPVDYDPPSPARSPTPTPSMPPPSRPASQCFSASRPPETPISASQRSFIYNLQQASVRPTGSQLRRTPKALSPRSARVFPTTGQREPKHSTPLRRAGTRGSPDSRDSTPLMRFSQREPGQIAKGSLRGSQIPRFSQDNTLSQRESSGEDYYNSQFSFDRQLHDISRFMEDDLAN